MDIRKCNGDVLGDCYCVGGVVSAAPERLQVEAEGGGRVWIHPPLVGDGYFLADYIRADLVDAKVKAAEARVREEAIAAAKSALEFCLLELLSELVNR